MTLEDYQKDIVRCGGEAWTITKTDEIYNVYSSDEHIGQGYTEKSAIYSALEYNGIVIDEDFE